MRKWGVKQKQLVAEFLSNLALAIITVGGISPLFDFKYPLKILILQFAISIISGTILLIISFVIVKK